MWSFQNKNWSQITKREVTKLRNCHSTVKYDASFSISYFCPKTLTKKLSLWLQLSNQNILQFCLFSSTNKKTNARYLREIDTSGNPRIAAGQKASAEFPACIRLGQFSARKFSSCCQLLRKWTVPYVFRGTDRKTRRDGRARGEKNW